jgi:hypothetical protein
MGQDCILQAGFSTGLLVLSSPFRRAPMKSALQLAKLPHKLSHIPRPPSTLFSTEPKQPEPAHPNSNPAIP